MLCCLEASLSSCGPATKSRTLGLWLTPYPLGLLVDGFPAHARYLDGRLWCSAEVAQRAEVVVAMGETFDPGDGDARIRASLAGTPTAALLTVIRAFSKVSSVELGLGPGLPDD
jgi:hypothetical protein